VSGGSEGKGTADAPPTVLVVVAAVLLVAPFFYLIASGGREPAQGDYEREIDRAQIALRANKPRESLVPLARAARLRPDAFAVHNNYCVAYGLLKRKREAVESCRRAVQIEPGSALARNNLTWVQGIDEGAAP
jgi:Tfp pilus assembly protein PilF